jgi:hypothetical protein
MRTPEYFTAYRVGHEDGYAGLSARPAVNGQSAEWSDGYSRGHAAGACTRAYAVHDAQVDDAALEQALIEWEDVERGE